MPGLERLTGGGTVSSGPIPAKGSPLPAGAFEVGREVFAADPSFPLALLRDSALVSNSASMMRFCREHGASLAPHGKTTMSPELIRRQLADGAWAITAASAWQARMMHLSGVRRILLANEVVVPAELRWLAEARHDGLDVFLYVDSSAGVAIADEALSGYPPSWTLPVLVEIGTPGGRGGVRSAHDALAVAEAASRSSRLRLIGVAGFEGILGPTDQRSAEEVVSTFLGEIVEAAHLIDARGWFDPDSEIIVSAGGSAYFDYVVGAFAQLRLRRAPRVVLRAGCYLTHDHGSLDEASPLGATPRVEGTQLRPAVEVWAAVLSRPEPNRAIVGAGKRDVSTDGLLPVVVKHRPRRTGQIADVTPRRITAVNDQHAFLDLESTDPLAVGDLVCLGISHPCTTFDKWRSIPVVDDQYRVTEVITTLF